MKLNALAFAAVTGLAMGHAQADNIVLNGTLAVTDPTFNRAFVIGSLSAVGTAVFYDGFSFIGVTPGAYTFTMVTGPTKTFDSFLALYAGGFSAAAPLTNLVALNDDLNGSLTSSGFTYTLNATTVYTVVSTSYANGTTGDYTTTIASVPVPEPESYALFVVGLAGLATWMRRQSRSA